MPETPLLCDPADLAVKLGVSDTDARLLVALRAASMRFRGAVRWQVHRVTDETLTLNAPGTRVLRLPIAYIVDVSSVRLDGTDLDVGTQVHWDEDGLLDLGGALWPRKRRAVEVTVTYGFDPIPGEIAEVVQDQAEATYNVIRGLQTKQVGGITQTFGIQEAVGVSQQWADVVARYRVRSGDRA